MQFLALVTLLLVAPITTAPTDYGPQQKQEVFSIRPSILEMLDLWGGDGYSGGYIGGPGYRGGAFGRTPADYMASSTRIDPVALAAATSSHATGVQISQSSHYFQPA
ncbi:hypothetical protein MJO28_016331 [Puccinia striiformis f. sp. tritici]|uniref:Uncharacterized protein n=1 Tax=Puccinia striiformis f. sp. tritici TaxID=168172 RepID=A0ACC0DPJ2_9BASI|nr:hypothetical protein Pst134EA_030542 [Puccinia striiformis f. sp. tritici]KAH9440470.1 hypothetical protein Pst134EB_031082 [Puccinia striiformis f. sp. tritici]KAH9446631.1 hypothetical protein Pst134EA_030542 [Puccinia striiformis f. sp. tritici]KAI7935031.1 hypothetical protein MJO29_016294 [Puccinia striiformis f. sp. tritici]KAI7935460.1 hypothetical protein MJO28_016331 [Puccinia striiformis f. sp. tritici]